MSENSADSTRQNGDARSGERDDPTRRRVLRATGAAAVGATGLAGVASATGGKGISWMAFCGCDDGFCIQWRRFNDEGELVSVAYQGECDAVYYKTGPTIYRHEMTRDSADLDWTDGDGNVRYPVAESANAGDGDPVASETPSDSRDPCGILDGSNGVKLEADQIESYEYDCPTRNYAESDDEEGGEGGGPPDDDDGRSQDESNGRDRDESNGRDRDESNGQGRGESDGQGRGGGNGRGRGGDDGRAGGEENGGGRGGGNGRGRGGDDDRGGPPGGGR